MEYIRDFVDCLIRKINNTEGLTNGEKDAFYHIINELVFSMFFLMNTLSFEEESKDGKETD